MTKSETKNPSSRGKRGLAPRALMDEGRRSALESLDRPASPASAFVRAALEAAAPHPEEPGTAPVSSRAGRTAVAEAPASTSSASAGERPQGERILKRIPLREVALANRRFQYRVTRTIAKLQESLLLHGQQIPVILRGTQAPYEIVSGFGRCEALAAAEAQGKLQDVHVWADLRPDLSDREAHEISVLENEDREGLSDLDRVNKAKKLKEEGYSIGEVASVLKKGERMVQYYLSLAAAPARITQAIEAGSLRPTHALVLTKFAREALAELSPEEVEAKLDELLAACARGASVPELRAAIAPAPAAPRLLVPRGTGFELRGFHWSAELSRDAKRALLAALDEARERLAQDLA